MKPTTKPNQDFNRNLEYKVHNKFFDILNDRLEETAKIGEAVYNDRNLMKEFFKKVNMLRVKYGEHYLTNNTKLKIMLLVVKNDIFGKYYNDVLNFINEHEYKRLNEDDKSEFNKIHNRALEMLEDVFAEINGELSEGDLLPKVVKSKKDKEQNDFMRGVGL